jgi:hypothetical protein
MSLVIGHWSLGHYVISTEGKERKEPSEASGPSPCWGSANSLRHPIYFLMAVLIDETISSLLVEVMLLREPSFL